MSRESFIEVGNFEKLEKLLQIIDNLPFGIIVQQNHAIVFANDKALEILNIRTANDIEYKILADFVDDEDKDKFIKLLERSISNNEAKICELKFKINNEIKYIQLNVNSLVNNKNLINIFTLNDITARKLTEIELKKSEEKFHSLTETIPDIILHLDLELNIKYINTAGKYFFDLLGNECVYTSLKDLYRSLSDSRNLEIWLDNISKLQETRSKQRFTTTTYKDGVPTYYDWFITPEFDVDDKICGILAIAHNITEYIFIQKELEQARQKAEASDKLKTAFLANMSHEIRTPMNALIGFSNLLAEDDISDEERKLYCESIQKSSRRLLNLVENIVELSKIEANEIEVHNKTFNLNDLLIALYDEFIPRARKKNLIFDYQANLARNKAFIVSDESIIKKIFTLLLDNAIKFTHSGKIDFGYSLIANKIHFYVKDTGVGISEEFLPRAFDKFSQENVEFNRDYEGSGLGLAIAKGLVNILGGEIRIDSKKFDGTIVHFKIPYKTIEKQESMDNKSVEKENKQYTILIAEDDNISYLLLKSILAKIGKYNILYAKNGLEAIDLAKNNTVDFIFMDIKMPQMDGFQATKHIKSASPSIPIFALTALAMMGDRERALNAGFDGYIAKPFAMNEIVRALEQYNLTY